MTDDDNEGYPGLRIEQVQAKIATGLKYLPSLVLILLGTNGTSKRPTRLSENVTNVIPRHEPELRRRKRP